MLLQFEQFFKFKFLITDPFDKSLSNPDILTIKKRTIARAKKANIISVKSILKYKIGVLIFLNKN